MYFKRDKQSMAAKRPVRQRRGGSKVSPKKKRQLYAIWYIASKIDSGKTYAEREINEVINSLTVFKDPATLRRQMYDRFLLDRSPDCKQYRMRSDMPTLEDFVQNNI